MAHFFLPVGLCTGTFCFCIFFCRLGNFVAGFLGPCRSCLIMAVVLLRHSTGHGAGMVEGEIELADNSETAPSPLGLHVVRNIVVATDDSQLITGPSDRSEITFRPNGNGRIGIETADCERVGESFKREVHPPPGFSLTP
jgi:hypothetical protein